MQNTPGIGAYLDAGSLKQFAGQAMEVLPGALSVAVFDVQGSIAWCGPGGGDNNLWSRISARDIVAADDDCCMDVPGTGFVYRFTLRRGRDKDAVGILAVLAGGDVRLSAFSAREEIADIIGCILKQLDIRMELSAVRQQSGRERKDMELLARLDDLRGQEGGASSLQEALCLTARHFDSDLVVMAIPDRGIHRAWRRDGVVNEQGCKAMSPILASLVAAAKDRRRVLIANAAGVIKRIAGIENQEAQILSSPVLAGGNEVAGVLGLVRAQKFSRFDVRLIRVVAARVAAFTEEADPSPRLPATRHDLLREIDRQLQSNPKASRALLLIDIDKLHVVNEMHGHFGGDAAIAGVISAAQKAGGDGAIVCNIGGGSIALYLPDAIESNAVSCADSIRKNLQGAPAAHEGRTVELTVSIGVALMPSAVQDGSSALNIAEVASRSAKARGGDQAVVFDNLDVSVMRRREDLSQVGRLQAALLDNRFVLYGQQIAALQGDDDRPRFEVLLRMLDEKGNILAPNRFLSAAERYQMMSSIDRWVVRETTRLLSSCENLLEVNLASFSINVSTQSMMDDEFANFVEQRVMESGIAPDTFCFEITETSAIRNLQRAQHLLQRLRRLGCRLALDDFGTGQCSFAYLKDLPVQYIKIDGTFVRDIADNPLSRAIVESVGKIAAVIKAYTIAEYAESDRILDCLREARIDFAQGYRIGKPRPLSDILNDFGNPMVSEADLRQASR